VEPGVGAGGRRFRGLEAGTSSTGIFKGKARAAEHGRLGIDADVFHEKPGFAKNLESGIAGGKR
jgi:hypothetical protein